jgi:hypothetical protein
MLISELGLRSQFNRAKAAGWLPFFMSGDYGMRGPILMGIASRESNLSQVVGDYGLDGRPNGFSLMQIDKRSYPEWVASGKWKDVGTAVKMGAFVLRSKYNQAEAAGVPAGDLMRVAVAMYNAGGHALHDYLIHGAAGADYRTTGHDYSADVLARTAVFERLLAPLTNPY